MSGVAGVTTNPSMRQPPPAGRAARRRVFGKRAAAWMAEATDGPGAAPAGSMDRDVAMLRRRIVATAGAPSMRLPWAVGVLVIAVLSIGLWFDAFEAATLLARTLARVM
jgi:hypothetical protein